MISSRHFPPPSPCRPPSMRSLRTSLVVFYFISMLIECATLAWTSHIDRAQTIYAFEQQNTELARALDEHLARTFFSAEQATQNIVEYLYNHDNIFSSDQLKLHKQLQGKAQLAPQIRAIVAIDANGIIQAHGLHYPVSQMDVSDRHYFKFHRDNPSPDLLISAPIVGRTDGRWLIPLSIRVNRPDGRFGGVLLADIEPDYFVHFYNSLKLSKGVSISIVHHDGQVLVRYPPDKSQYISNIRDTNPAEFDRLVKLGTSVYLQSYPKEKDRFITFLFSHNGLPLIVQIITNSDLVFVNYKQDNIARFSTAFLTVFILTIFFFILMYQIKKKESVESLLYLTQFTVDEAPDMVIWCSIDGFLCYANKTFSNKVGFSPEVLIKHRITEFFLLSEQDWQTGKQTLNLKPRLQITSKLTSSGQEPVEMTLSRIEYNRKEYICVSARDISELKRAEIELRKHRDHLQEIVNERTAEVRVVLDASPLAIMFSINNQIHLINPAFEALFGYSQSEVIGQPEHIVYGSVRRLSALQAEIDEKIFTQRGTYQGEIELYRRNQSRFWALLFIKALSSSTSHGIVSIIQDITISRTAAQALRQSERLKRNIIETSADGFLLIDSTRKIIDTNQSFCQLMSLTREAIIGSQPESLLGNTAHLLFPEIMPPQSTTPQSNLAIATRIGEVVLHTTEGRAQPFLANTGIVRDEQQKTEYLFAFLTHIGPLKEIEKNLAKAKEAAESASMAKSSFLASMSHELRTPMHAILSFSEMGSAKTQDHHIRRYFERISTSGKRLLILVNDLLDVSKLEANQMTYTKEPHQLQVTTNAAITEIYPLLTEKNITIRVDERTPPLVAVYDHTRILQVIVNLLSNAIKFSPQDSTIYIDFLANQALPNSCPAIGLTVCDEGPGIHQDDLECIFDKFSQGKRTTLHKGSGLGLAICRQIISDHHGIISAKNHPIQGAIFSVWIPTGKDESGLPSVST